MDTVSYFNEIKNNSMKCIWVRRERYQMGFIFIYFTVKIVYLKKSKFKFTSCEINVLRCYFAFAVL